MQPTFELIADDNRITDFIRNRFISLEIYDSEQYEQDYFTLTIADYPVAGESGDLEHVELPKPGVVLTCSLGYGDSDNLIAAGEWICTGVETSGGTGGDLMVISGTGVYYGWQTEKKSRSWNETTLGDLLRTIAAEHELKPNIDACFDEIELEHIDQTGESDMHFLRRLGMENNAVAKFKGESLIFVKRNQGKNANGEDFPVVTLEKKDLSSWSMSVPTAKHYKSVEVKYKDFTTGGIHHINRGEGEPVLRIESIQFSEAAAERLAEVKLEAMKQEQDTLSVQGPVPFDSLLPPETTLDLTDLRPGMGGRWRVQTQRISLNTGGFSFEAMCVRAPD